MKKIIYICVFVLSACVVIGTWSAAVLGELENNIVRLHIIANSDTEYDQSLKLEVRDHITQMAFKTGKTPDLAQLEYEANRFLKSRNAPYGAKVCFGKYYIDRRSYKDFILPGGMYTAARIELGEAKGKNWWCVLSPPLCFTRSAFGETQELSNHLGEETMEAVENDKITVKLKILEVVSGMIHRFAG